MEQADNPHPSQRPGSASLVGQNQQFEYMASEIEDEEAYLRDITGMDNLEEATSLRIIVNTSVSTISHLGSKLPNLEEINLSGSILESVRDLGTKFKSIQGVAGRRAHLGRPAGLGANATAHWACHALARWHGTGGRSAGASDSVQYQAPGASQASQVGEEGSETSASTEAPAATMQRIYQAAAFTVPQGQGRNKEVVPRMRGNYARDPATPQRPTLNGLAGVSALPALRELYASFNDISELQPLDGSADLEVLDLEGNCIPELDSVYCLCTACPRLQSLTLSGNPLYTSTGQQHQICSMLPSLQLLDDEPVAAHASTPAAAALSPSEGGAEGAASSGGVAPNYQERSLVIEGIKHARVGLDSHEFKELEMSLLMTADALPSDTRPTTSAMMMPVTAGNGCACSIALQLSGLSEGESPTASTSRWIACRKR
eukprot:gene10183-8090_t